MVKISSIFVAFLENMNFNELRNENLNSFLIRLRKLFKGRSYSREETICENTIIIIFCTFLMSFSNYFIGVPYAAKFEPYTLTETTVNLSWKVNASYNAPVINYQLEFQEIPHGQWITINVPAKG